MNTRTIVFLRLFLFGSVVTLTRAHELVITLSGFRHGNGRALVGISLTKDAFPERPDRSTTVAIDPTTLTATVVLGDIPAGSIAVSVVHDENGNGKLDKNLVGIPTEPVGFSNGARPFFGPPSFASARLTKTDGSQAIAIKVGGSR